MFASEDGFHSSKGGARDRMMVSDEDRQMSLPPGHVAEHPGAPTTPARPVSARVFQTAVSRNKRAGGGVHMYSNDLFGDVTDGDILAHVDEAADCSPHSQGHQPAPLLAGGVTVQQRLQQQKTLAEQRRLERMRGGVAMSKDDFGGKAAAGPIGHRGPEGLPSGKSAAVFSIHDATNGALDSPSGDHFQIAPAGDVTRFSDRSKVERDLEEKGMDTVFDPTGGLDTMPSTTQPGSEAMSRFALPEHATRDELRKFVMMPGPRHHPCLCYIVRDRKESKTYPKYSLFADDTGQLLISARKRKKSRSSNYLISLDDNDLGRRSESYFGKVRSNFIGTEFSIYDRGENPLKRAKVAGGGEGEGDAPPMRMELGSVLYQHNLLGTRGPRKMTAIVPKVPPAAQRPAQAAADTESLLERYKSGKQLGDLVIAKNKTPKWNDQLNAYCLNFKGRVTEASVKNFQLVPEDDQEHVVLQFGKIGEDTFTMDFMWPMSALQAFAICLTSFDSKLACE
ncbi:unnamed protein product [Ostreobium quekettii]|uniref:Tubby-like F-box protein n=1 Tax=Ostreobium quekettii TaxID=121088 RepID=A0A8S1IUV6_9CHLO|nr:unnamed protein product [Ostreobium quekettii]|eukprot:evm.model.scf_678.2 EVM.evm.TU.scf_678.2   scf_678:30400-37110(+)